MIKRCKWLYADWCHKPERCEEIQEKCIDDLDFKCPDYEQDNKFT